jgi:signal transduction histidine kinase
MKDRYHELGGNILIVDDVPDNLHLLSQILTKEGYVVRCTVKGSMGLKVASSGWAELILLDIQMSELDGYQVCEQLQANPQTRSIPVIFLSALDGVFDKVKAFAVGGVDYITKPFDVQEVLARVRTHLQLSNLHQTLAARVEAQTLQLTAALQEANAASLAKSQFLSTMSHELRTPLNAILGFTNLMLRDKLLTSEQQEYLEIIDRSGAHLLSLINDVLEVSKIEAGYLALDERDFDLDRLLVNLTEMLTLKAKNKGLEFKLIRSTELTRYLRTDCSKLRQVLINLLDNALKFTTKGSVTLRVSSSVICHSSLAESNISQMTSDQEEQVTIQFEIEDTGLGIAAEELQFLFAPFCQTETGRNSQSGTGLGLSIAKQYVKLMGGDLQVQSVLGKGTKFDFTLPMTIVTSSEIEELSSSRRVVALQPEQQQFRILIAEDKLENRQWLLKLLTLVGFEVRESENGEAAIAVWENWSPHLILMDMQMPVIDGYEATKTIKAKCKDRSTIIIALTASVFKEQQHLIIAAGCDDFLPKPFSEELLWTKIARYLPVKYLYEEPLLEDSLDLNCANFLLTKSSLSFMPQEWIDRLRYYATVADGKQILELIDEIPLEKSDIALHLKNLVSDFSFESILEIKL